MTSLGCVTIPRIPATGRTNEYEIFVPVLRFCGVLCACLRLRLGLRLALRLLAVPVTVVAHVDLVAVGLKFQRDRNITLSLVPLVLRVQYCKRERMVMNSDHINLRK